MNDSELLNIFRVEVDEYLQALNNALLQIEMIPPEDAEFGTLVREMNRVAHSMKGAARAVGIGLIETIAHFMEEVFGSAQKGKLKLTPEQCDTLYDGLDLIQNIVTGQEPNEVALAAVLEKLEDMAAIAPAPDQTTDSRQMRAVKIVDDGTGENGADSLPEPEQKPAKKSKKPPAEPASPTAKKQTGPVAATPIHPAQGSPRRTTSTSSLPTVTTGTIPLGNDAGTVVVRPVEETVRVTVSKLDQLMAEATELLVARMHSEEQQRAINDARRLNTRWQREWRTIRAAYIRLARRLQDSNQQFAGSELPILLKFLETNQRYLTESARQLTQLAHDVAQYNTHLVTLSDQLQDDIGGMRLLPFESIVGGFQRMVRDLARDMEKQIQLEVEGSGVEIDKTVLENLKDPLMHLLRNAIDHAIESPTERVDKGKSPVGRIEINVEQRGSEIIIGIEDDGRGIDPQRIRRSIVKNGLMSDAEVGVLSDDEARSYVFHPGLSTSTQVTPISGRGLGMDIVRDRVESLRGRVSLQSVMGEGTIVTLNVPVSLTRIRCVLMRVGDQQFAVPSAMVIRMETIPRSSIFTAEGREMILVNERPMPLAALGAVLDIPAETNTDDGAQTRVLALQATDRAIAFEVEELLSEQELVLKPLGPELARAPFVAGAALLGNGDVIVVLDANDLVRRASGAALPRRRVALLIPTATERRLRVLVVDDSITTRTLEKNILETAGFDVRVAIDGIEAWRTLTEEEFDLVISDVEMPNMNGLELTQRIKGDGRTNHLPVVLLTSLGKPEQREAGLRAGADAYLVKSQFDQGELLQVIQSVV